MKTLMIKTVSFRSKQRPVIVDSHHDDHTEKTTLNYFVILSNEDEGTEEPVVVQ